MRRRLKQHLSIHLDFPSLPVALRPQPIGSYSRSESLNIYSCIFFKKDQQLHLKRSKWYLLGTLSLRKYTLGALVFPTMELCGTEGWHTSGLDTQTVLVSGCSAFIRVGILMGFLTIRKNIEYQQTFHLSAHAENGITCSTYSRKQQEWWKNLRFHRFRLSLLEDIFLVVNFSLTLPRPSTAQSSQHNWDNGLCFCTGTTPRPNIPVQLQPSFPRPWQCGSSNEFSFY